MNKDSRAINGVLGLLSFRKIQKRERLIFRDQGPPFAFSMVGDSFKLCAPDNDLT